jgi:hypothetical protein
MTTEALPVSGTALDPAVRRLLSSLNYPLCNAAAALEYVETRGTIEGAEFIDREDWPAINDLVARHTGDVEADPSAWPAWTDAETWAPSGPGPDAPAFEPSEEDRRYWAEFAPEPAVGGAPAADRPIARPWDDAGGVRSRPVAGYTDADQFRNHGCV